MHIEDQIKANADLVIAKLGPLSDIDFGLNHESVVWVAGFIERQRQRDDIDADTIDGLVEVLGSFLGECMVANYAGQWQEADGRWGVQLKSKVTAFPFSKVRKQFDNGIEGGDNIASFYEDFPFIAKR